MEKVKVVRVEYLNSRPNVVVCNMSVKINNTKKIITTTARKKKIAHDKAIEVLCAIENGKIKVSE